MKGMRKIRRGAGFRGVLNYTTEDGRGQVIGGNMAGSDPRALAAEFGQVRRLRPDIEKPVWHNSLRLPKGERISSEKWQEVADDYMRRMGFGDQHPRAYILHDDPDGQHIHIVASRIGLDGSLYLGRNENLISTRHIAALELEHGLTITPGPGDGQGSGKNRPKKAEIDKALRTQSLPPRMALQRLIDQALQGQPTASDFKKALQENGVLVEANLASTGRLNGIRFQLEGSGIWFKGSSLGKAYTPAGLQSRGLNYLPERDLPALAGDQPERQASIHGPSRPPLLDWMHAQRRGAATVYRWPNGAAALLDTGDQVKLAGRATDAKVRAAVEAAIRKGWDSIKAAGEKDFQEAVAREAARRGVRVSNPELQDTWESVRKEMDDEQAGRSREAAAQAALGQADSGDQRAAGRAADPRDADTDRAVTTADRAIETGPDPLGFLDAIPGEPGRPGSEGDEADAGQPGQPAERRDKPPAPGMAPAPSSAARRGQEVSTWSDWLADLEARARADRAARLRLERIRMLMGLNTPAQLPHAQPNQAYLAMLAAELRQAQAADRPPQLGGVDDTFRAWMQKNPQILHPLRGARAEKVIDQENLDRQEERHRQEIRRQAAEEARRQAEREREREQQQIHHQQRDDTPGRERPRPRG